MKIFDQASKLRTMIDEKNTTDNWVSEEAKEKKGIKIYSIVSGKGGVGKTSFSVNLAIALQQTGKRVVILDADIGFSNANILLGVETKLTLNHLLSQEAFLEDIIVKGPEGVALISGGTDLFQMEGLNYTKQQQIIDELGSLEEYDILIIDNGAGMSKQSLTFAKFADEVILVTTPEPTSITDAYSYLKALSIYKIKESVKVVVNQVPDTSYGKDAFEKLKNTSNQFLDLELENIGFIFSDSRVNRSIMDQCPLLIIYPNALASRNIIQISRNILEDKNYDFKVSSFKQLGNRIIKMFG